MKKLALFLVLLIIPIVSWAEDDATDAAGILPGSPLYFADVGLDKLNYYLSMSADLKAVRAATIADERLSEMQVLYETQKLSYITEAKEEHEFYIVRLEEDMAQIPEGELNYKVMAQIQNQITVHKDKVAALQQEIELSNIELAGLEEENAQLKQIIFDMSEKVNVLDTKVNARAEVEYRVQEVTAKQVKQAVREQIARINPPASSGSDDTAATDTSDSQGETSTAAGGGAGGGGGSAGGDGGAAGGSSTTTNETTGATTNQTETNETESDDDSETNETEDETEDAWCNDTDGGWNVYEKGTATDENDVASDSCDGSILLNEVYCDATDTYLIGDIYSCSSDGMVCEDGACIEDSSCSTGSISNLQVISLLVSPTTIVVDETQPTFTINIKNNGECNYLGSTQDELDILWVGEQTIIESHVPAIDAGETYPLEIDFGGTFSVADDPATFKAQIGSSYATTTASIVEDEEEFAPPAEDEYWCTDTDDGEDIYTKGSCTSSGEYSSREDDCGQGGMVGEIYCNGEGSQLDCAKKYLSCPSGYTCSDGACVSSGNGTGGAVMQPPSGIWEWLMDLFS